MQNKHYNLIADSTPIIRAQKGNAAEMVARKLEGRLRDRLLNIRADSGSLELTQRPCKLRILFSKNKT
jgi:hypothetical protein